MVGGAGDDQVGGGDVRLLLKAREDEAKDLGRRLTNPDLNGVERMDWETRLRYLEDGVIPALRRSLE